MGPTSEHTDLIVLGTGAAGSSGWSSAVKLGKQVTIFDGGTLGGECPTYACVPSKALLYCAEVYATAGRAAQFGIDLGSIGLDYARVKERKDVVVARTGAAKGDRPYREAGVKLVQSEARFVAPRTVEAAGVRYTADRFLIATGSTAQIPPIDGIEVVGYLTFKEAINLSRLPASILILGGGPVGCEFAQLFSAFGVRVVIADHNQHLLGREDPEIGEEIARLFRKRGVRVLNGATIKKFSHPGDVKRATIEHAGRQETIEVEELLVATGKQPITDLGLESARVTFDRKKGITVDATLRTTNPAIFAAGDCVGPYRFTHVASYQGQLAVENAFAKKRREADYRAVPRCVFTSPEVATVGLTEQEARAAGKPIGIGHAKMSANDRASGTEQLDGFVKVITDASGQLLGAAIVAPRAGELIHELTLAIALKASAAQVASVIHAFPTFSEAVQAACAAVVVTRD